VVRDGWFPDHREISVSPLGRGHINDTYLVQIVVADQVEKTDQVEKYVLQRISSRVFNAPGKVAENVERVLEHFRAHDLTLPELVVARSAAGSWRDPFGELWRLWRFRKNGRTLVKPISLDEARAAGVAFGQFQRHMQSFSGPALAPVIEGFGNLAWYLAQFDDARKGWSGSSGELDLEFIDQRRGLAGQFPAGHDYIHGDCKLDNLLFARTSAAVDCVLDLDTVMQGHWAWDLGDLVRSLATTEGALDGELFAAACAGFLSGSGRRATTAELLAAPRYVTFMLGVRFLTDHLLGDRYFKVSEPGENRTRSRQQFALLVELEQHQTQLQRALEREI
jgi:hypothetical protein